jgi:hypothetical protein
MACSWLFGVTQLLAVTPFTCGENPDLCAPLCSSVKPHDYEERQAHIRRNLILSSLFVPFVNIASINTDLSNTHLTTTFLSTAMRCVISKNDEKQKFIITMMLLLFASSLLWGSPSTNITTRISLNMS